MVFITISQKRIIRRYVIKETVGALREIHIININRSETMPVAIIVPFVSPPGSSNNACVFRALLIIERHTQLGACSNLTLKIAAQEREFEFREIQRHIKRIFHVAIMKESLKIAGN